MTPYNHGSYFPYLKCSAKCYVRGILEWFLLLLKIHFSFHILGNNGKYKRGSHTPIWTLR